MTGSEFARSLIAHVLWVAALVATPASAEVLYYHTDHLGSVAAVTDEQGQIIERREYEPFGLRVGEELAGGPGYTGHVHDGATGLDYMQQRYYDPRIGSFLSVDPVTSYSSPMEAFNRYRYANNNPYHFVDPAGMQACGKSTTCRLAQGETGGTISLISHAADGSESSQVSSSSSNGQWNEWKGRLGLSGELTKNGNILDIRALGHDIFYPLMDSPTGSGFKVAGLGALMVALRAEGQLTFKSTHYASRLESAGLNVSRTEAVVGREIARILPNMAVGTDVSGRVRVSGVLVEYRARALQDGGVNVGTIFPVK